MFIIQFFDVKILSYVLFDIIVHFIIQKLKNKHTFLKKPQKVAKLSKAKFSHFEGTRGDKKQIFPTQIDMYGCILEEVEIDNFQHLEYIYFFIFY